MDFFATAAKGTEPALRDELRELGLRGVRADRGGVHFAGAEEDGFRACLESACAVRVLAPLADFDAKGGDELYEGVRAIDWRPFLTPSHTLAVRAACRSSALTHTQFIAQRTKDAIVDPMRERLGARPSVDLDDPDVSIFVHLVRDHATVYVDLAGEPLHRRGYRGRGHEAPLKETLAAAVVRLSGWDRRAPLLDPMCGSGTLAIEAAMLAQGVAPGLGRARFGFERWASHGPERARRVAELREALRARPRREGPEIAASDADPIAVETAREAARAAGVRVRVERRDVRDVAPGPAPGFVIVNPPYGQRLAEEEDLYRDMAKAFARLHGYGLAVLAGTPRIARAIRWKPARSLVLFNGPIECRLLTYSIP